jgi:putative membrane protein
MWAMGWMMMGMVLFWGLLIIAAIWLVRLLFQNGTSQPTSDLSHLSPREILNLPYSRGEITREQYEQMKQDLEN